MDVNGSTFHLLLGKADWRSCTDEAGEPLGTLWAAGAAAPVVWTDADEVALPASVFRFPAARGDAPPALSDRRGAGRDRYGNWYWIGPDARGVLVGSAGDGSVAQFWPGHGECPAPPAAPGAFGPPADAPPRAPAQPLRGAAVTEDHRLVVGTLAPGGLLVFDLLTGGPPAVRVWPAGVPFAPWDIAPRPDGGVFVLDRDAGAVWELDRRLQLVAPPPGVAPPGAFGPGAGAPAPPPAPVAVGPDAIAVEAVPDGGFLVLDRGEAEGHSLVRLFRDGTQVGPAAAVSDAAQALDVVGHDFALAGGLLYVADGSGNQSYAFTPALGPAGPTLALVSRFFPMRRFGGKAIVAAGGAVYYDVGDELWAPLVCQPRAGYAESGTVITPGFDGGEPACVWHRLLADAWLPPGTGLHVWSRAADEADALPAMPWQPEPDPLARPDGPEVPFAATGAYTTTELLFQRAVGRHLQVRLELYGDGRATPAVRALRAWYPRFSYLERYLPGAYRDDPGSASFLDRYLANLEGLATALEDRGAAGQVLLSPAAAPADALAWLAGFLDLALDPLWDERRRRLLLANAMRFYAARGTLRGLLMALRFALDPCVDEGIFAEARPPALATARIVERFRARRTPGVVLGDPTEPPPPRVVVATARWRPEQGGDALRRAYDDYRAALGLEPARYPITDPGDADRATWRAFSIAALGFVPAAADPARWRAFLAHRYPNPRAVAAAYGVPGAAPAEFASLAPPAGPDPPPDGAALDDWFQFQGVVLPMERAAHRFTVLLPWPMTLLDTAGRPVDQDGLRDIAQRVVDLQKPAHTVFGVRFFWAAFRVGEARLGDDTLLGRGSRAPELLPPAVAGRADLGATRLGGATGTDVVRRPLPPPANEEAP